jgi:hypothetical protein
VEGLEGRRLLNAASGTPTTGSGSQIDPGLFATREPRNIGTVPAFQVNEDELPGTNGSNDSFLTADVVPLGTGAGQQDTVDVTGFMGITTSPQGVTVSDVDTYAVDLRAGDILDLAVIGAGSNITVLNSDGSIWYGTDVNTVTPGQYPNSSPLMNTGNAVAAQVVPEDGRYYVTLAPSNTGGNYTLGMRVYRPVLEQTPIGTQQILYLDFDGGLYPTTVFESAGLPFGIVRFTGATEALDVLGILDPAPGDDDLLIDYVLEEVEQQLGSFATLGTNGDYDSTGAPGQYGVTVLNSRDHADPGTDNPLVTRVQIGTEVGTNFTGLYGISESIDIGNFDPSEIVLVLLEAHLAGAQQFPISPTVSLLDAIAQQMASTITHEFGHSIGMRHTDGNNNTGTLTDEGSASLDAHAQGIGNDGIFGTVDDEVPGFFDDFFSTAEGDFYGTQQFAAAGSHVLSTGTVGSVIRGTIYNDANRDGNFNGDSPLPGVIVYADANNNGRRDATDPVSLSRADGTYGFLVAPNQNYNVYAITPEQFVGSTATMVNVAAGTSGVDFGFTRTISDVTGTKFADTNGNGFFDENESGIEGVYIYLDLDGDNRPDLGEPSTRTNANGEYSLNFPGPGTYTIREVVEPGFEQTFPSSGEITAVFQNGSATYFDGSTQIPNADFGNLPSRDYGDAPDSYGTTVAANGPSHGISVGLGLGATVDRETNGIPTPTALGDDNNNLDDEDGIQILSPLGPGGAGTIQVSTRNTTGSPAYLQGWIDFNANGQFDAAEKVFSDVALGAGTTNLQVNVPANAVVGSTYARFRYSPTAGLGPRGEADLGEVEDYQIDILRQAEVANDDEFTVSRNSLSNQLDVLANDFETSLTTLTITQIGDATTDGVVSIAQDGRSAFYTPPNGFTGRDQFEYVVRDNNGNQYSANVVVNVNFQSSVPIAVDDTFDIPQGSSNRALNVLDNDVPSVAGGLRITSVTAGDQGGQVSLDGGGQFIRYTPQPGFAGTEQFTYSVQDGNGSISQAEVTVNSQPGARNDDRVDFTIGIFDVTNNQPISNVQVGQEFLVRVSVEELNNPAFSDEGVASAFLDLLYTDELVRTQDTIPGNPFGFDITFGDNFQGGGFKLGDATVPGLIDDVGAVQPIPVNGQFIEHSDPAELFTVTMTAVSPGVALFASDPADVPQAETILIGEDVALTPAQQRLGRTELTIFPASDDFASAIDDAFVNGTDSQNTVISSGNAPNVLDVLANDNFGPTDGIREFGIVTQPSLGNVLINDRGTPNDLSDDFIEYYADLDANGFDRFTYVIVSNDGVRSTAEVTMAIGNAPADDLAEISFGLVDQFGNPISSVRSNQTFGVEVYVEDLRTAAQGNTYVFAAYMDMLYDAGLISPADVPPGGRYDFDVEFDGDFDASAGVGTAVRPGIIDEFGSLLLQNVAEGGGVTEPNLMATVFFTAGSVSQQTVTEVIGSPADASPFQDTLLFDRDDPVPVSRIRYNELSITINPGSPLQNPAMAEDVNNDGFVTPSDALSVINTIARQGEGESGSTASNLYTDVNGDLVTSAIDALRVINYLAVLAASSPAEGESAATAQDEVLTDLGSDSQRANEGQPTAATNLAPLQDDSDDEDEALLQLLASDQSGLA